MKCKKKLVAISVPVVIVFAAIVGCIVFFIPKKNKTDIYYQEFDGTKGNDRLFPLCFGNDCIVQKLEIPKPCDGKDCLKPSSKSKPLSMTYRHICTSEECVHAAARMLSWMDKSADVCEDFYSYACGNFVRAHSLPEGWDVYSSNDVRNEDIELKLKNILETPAVVNDSISINKTKDIYASCMDTEEIDETSVDTLMDVLSERGILSVGEWPLLDPDWNDCRLDKEWKMARLNALGIDSLVRLETNFDGRDGLLKAVLSVADPMIDSSCGSETSEKALEHKALLQSVLDVFEIANISESDIDDVIRFDLQFCNATKDCRNQNYKSQVRFADFASNSGASTVINWFRWRNTVFSELLLQFPYYRLDISVKGVQLCDSHIYELLSQTSSKVLANYLTWKFVFHNLGFLGRPFRQLLENHRHLFQRVTMKSDRWMPRWRQCVSFIKEMMPMALLKAYYDSYYTVDVEMEMDEIVGNIKKEFMDIVLNPKELIADKLNITHRIYQVQVEKAYPYKDDTFYDRFYSDITLYPSFLQNGMKLMTQRMRKLLLGVATMRQLSDMDYAVQTLYQPLQLNATSNAESIVITLPQQLQWVTSTFPKYQTLSTIGFFVGKELARGSYLKDLKWGHHGVRTRCLETIDYQQFSTNEKELFKSFLDEQLYHKQGIYLAFKAYLEYLSSVKNGNEYGLPGFQLTDVTHQQLFFISYAQESCEIRKDSSSLLSAHWRVNEVLKNSPFFSEAFKCRRKTKCPLTWT